MRSESTGEVIRLKIISHQCLQLPLLKDFLNLSLVAWMLHLLKGRTFTSKRQEAGPNRTCMTSINKVRFLRCLAIFPQYLHFLGLTLAVLLQVGYLLALEAEAHQ
jgi:hypothetical protein